MPSLRTRAAAGPGNTRGQHAEYPRACHIQPHTYPPAYRASGAARVREMPVAHSKHPPPQIPPDKKKARSIYLTARALDASIRWKQAFSQKPCTSVPVRAGISPPRKACGFNLPHDAVASTPTFPRTRGFSLAPRNAVPADQEPHPGPYSHGYYLIPPTMAIRGIQSGLMRNEHALRVPPRLRAARYFDHTPPRKLYVPPCVGCRGLRTLPACPLPPAARIILTMCT